MIFRQKALKALNERMSKLEQPSSWPSLDEPTEDIQNGDIEVIEESDIVVVEHKDHDEKSSDDNATAEIT